MTEQASPKRESPFVTQDDLISLVDKENQFSKIEITNETKSEINNSNINRLKRKKTDWISSNSRDGVDVGPSEFDYKRKPTSYQEDEVFRERKRSKKGKKE